jgi:CRISPR system Cascade subunit CasE
MTYYLSCLDLDLRPTDRGVQLWLANPYRIHQRICMAFDDPGRLLFRAEERPRLRLLVLSAVRPDWGRAFADFPAVLDGPPRFKTYEPQAAPGQRLRFLLRANPTVKRDGRRHGLFREEEQRAWLDRKGRDGGFTLLTVLVEGGLNQVSALGPHRDGGPQTHYAVDYEGVLRVDDPARFTDVLYHGLGSAKAYGFGLLSIVHP